MVRLSAGNNGAGHQTWLVFALGPYVMCAPAVDVEGIIQRPDSIAKLPLTPDYALGAFLFRGRSAAAISLRKKLKLRHGEDRASGPFIVARIGEALVAFWVDEVKDVMEEKDAEWRPVPAPLEGGLFERFAIREKDLILQTQFAALREATVDFDSFAAWVAAEDAQPAVSAPAHARRPAQASSDGEVVSEPQAANQSRTAPATEQVHGGASVESAATAPTLAMPATERTSVKHQRRVDSPAARPRVSTTAAASSVVLPLRRGAAAYTLALPPAAPTLPGSQPIGHRAEDTSGDVSPHREETASPPENQSFAWHVALAAVTALVALAGLAYALLPGPSPDVMRARISQPSTESLPAREAPSVPHHESHPATNAMASTKPGPIVLTVEHASRREETAHAQAVGAASSGHVHVVVSGDTLWAIAKKHVGDPLQYPELARLSRIHNPDLIHPGDVVRIQVGDAK